MDLTPKSTATNGAFPYAVRTICASNILVFLEAMLKVKKITNSFLLVNYCSHRKDCDYIYWLQ